MWIAPFAGNRLEKLQLKVAKAIVRCRDLLRTSLLWKTRWNLIWPKSSEVLLGKVCTAFLTTSAEKFRIVNEVILVRPIGKPSELRQMFLCIYVLFKRFAFSPLPVPIFPAMFRKGGGGDCYLPFPIFSTKVLAKLHHFDGGQFGCQRFWDGWFRKLAFASLMTGVAFQLNPPVILLPRWNGSTEQTIFRPKQSADVIISKPGRFQRRRSLKKKKKKKKKIRKKN